MKTVYLDYAAATPLDPLVLKAMEPYFTAKFYNPSASSLAAGVVSQDIETARQQVAHWLGARPAEIIFTSGGTEANNFAVKGILEQYPAKKVLVSAIEHESVLAPAAQYSHGLVSVTAAGLVDTAALKEQLDDDTVLVSVMYANNEIGTIQPLKEVAALIADVRRTRSRKGNQLPLYFHTDACQAAQFLDLHAARLGVDLMTLNAGKIYGPKQCGALYVKRGIGLRAQIVGGGQEKGLRSGTESPANIAGLAKALDLVQNRRHDESKRLSGLRDNFIAKLEQTIPKLIINGSRQHRLPNNVHFTILGQDNERLIMMLDEKGIIAAAGSACSASKEEASHVLKAIGRSDQDAYASLRLTFGRHTTAAELEYTLKTLAELL